MNLTLKRMNFIVDLNRKGFTDGQIWVMVKEHFDVGFDVACIWVERCKKICGESWKINLLTSTIQEVA